jgi:electron transfer flavoprotein alpha subunit
MSVLVFAELAGGKFKKPAFEAASYASDFAQSQNLPLYAAVIGHNVEESELRRLGEYGVEKILYIDHPKLETFTEAAYAGALKAAAEKAGAQYAVLPQSYNGRSIAPRFSVLWDAALISGVISLAAVENGKPVVRRSAYSTKGIETALSHGERTIFTVKANSYGLKPNPQNPQIEKIDYAPADKDFVLVPKRVEKASDKISLTEAEVVVSAGRGLKGPENWGMIEELAEALGAATACSKPVADVHWRPHHEHVGQTGIQIAPSVYIAIGISGAIQHLAGVNSSKTIIVINKDSEAPFFKAADYGIVGDAFEVVPELLKAVKSAKN